jgi:hypothetical protein
MSEQLPQKFGRLTIIADGGGNHHRKVTCRCDCGQITEVFYGNLTRGHTRSCGCYGRTYHVKHGMGNTPEYDAWARALARCTNPNNPKYHRYGGRGIKVCERWKDFRNFIADMGLRPNAEHSIDRIDNNGNYEPGNCRWTTRSVQQRNRHNNVFYTLNGLTLTEKDWSLRLGIPVNTLTARRKRGLPVEDILSLRYLGRLCKTQPRLPRRQES